MGMHTTKDSVRQDRKQSLMRLNLALRMLPVVTDVYLVTKGPCCSVGLSWRQWEIAHQYNFVLES